MKHRKLRIAWSVAWGILAVLLFGLWAQSYWHWCSVRCNFTSTNSLTVCTEDGVTAFTYLDIPSRPPNQIVKWLECQSYPPRSLESMSPMRFTSRRFFLYRGPQGLIVGIHLLVFALIFGMLAIVSWIKWSTRFTLRTLLIATTLVAAVLGLIVWLR